MPAIQVNKLCYQLNNGVKLFENLSFTLPKGVTALVGRNGVGKSILTSLLTKEIKPTYGTVSSDVSVHIFKQNNSTLFKEDESISSFLGVDKQIVSIGTLIDPPICGVMDPLKTIIFALKLGDYFSLLSPRPV